MPKHGQVTMTIEDSMDQTLVVFSPEDWEAFQIALDAPPRVIPALQRLFHAPSVFDESVRGTITLP